MKINVKAVNEEWLYREWTGKPFYNGKEERIPLPRPEMLGVHEYDSLEACLELLEEVYGVGLIVGKEDGIWKVVLWNDYLE